MYENRLRVILIENGYIANWSVTVCDKQYIFLLLKYSSSVFTFDFPINDGNSYSNLSYQLFFKLAHLNWDNLTETGRDV